MTISEARKIVSNFDENSSPDEDQVFMFTEAMNFLINEEHNPRDMLYLGGYYYDLKHFDLALKYYEMAASYDYDEAYNCLGYIWYYGRTGQKDYEKAFHYFSKLMNKGDLIATYKIADMYKNGYYVTKDEFKYEEIIEDLYPKVCKLNDAFDPIPEVYTRLARIRKKQGNIDEAINLYMDARYVLSIRLKYNPFFGNINIMKWLIEDLYTMIEFDEEVFELYDLFYLMKAPHEVSFTYEDRRYTITSEIEGEESHICFDNIWYRTIDDFISKATIDNTKLTAIQDEFYDYEVTD